MKSLFVIGLLTTTALLAYLALSSHTHSEATEEVYNLYKLRFGKTYSPEENRYRFNLFRDSYKKMIEHNSKETQWKMGINQFSDMTQ